MTGGPVSITADDARSLIYAFTQAVRRGTTLAWCVENHDARRVLDEAWLY